MSRPREFDEQQALDAAMTLFWRHGYEGTSLSALTDAMGISRPSLYAAFGNKESLFQRVVARYLEGPGAGIAAALRLPTAKQAVEAILRLYADSAGMPDRPRGCLLVNSAMSCSPEAGTVRADLSGHRVASVELLRKRFERAQREGDLAKTANPGHLARYFWAVLNGMAIAASDGATRPQLRELAALAMHAWPRRT